MPGSDDEFAFFDEDEFDEADLVNAVQSIERAYVSGTSLPPKSLVSRPGLKQKDLFGGTVAPVPAPKAGPSRTGSGGGRAASGGGEKETTAKVRAIKVWDRGSFAKHGWSKRVAAEMKAKAKGKGKGRAYASDEEPWEGEEVVDDDDDVDSYLDQSYDPNAPLLPIKWSPDPKASETWQYPVQDDKPLRTYQYNIVHRALFEDTLVSLPTGLGKTFIAACVMLNFYRWYPRGKIVFLAPTRPLVTQQIKACHYIAGIPQTDCIELTGQTAPSLRAVAWATKRVIYCTPQTLENDLAKGRVDPRDITCLVVDEAHRATGDYSYGGVVRFIMSRNSHFRVLALTATPGANGEAVQEVLDNLHIGKIEVRTDDSFDIKPYVHKKSFDLTVVPLGSQLSAIRDRWGSLMKNYMGPLLAAKLIFESNPVMLSPFAVTMANGKIRGLPGGAKAGGRFFPMIKILASMARGMEYLVIQSLSSFITVLKDIDSAGPKTLTTQPAFRELLSEVVSLQKKPGYVGHPKMERLRTMCIEHFVEAEDMVDDDGKKKETRVMVFCNFRAVVDELVECLNQQQPLIKATAFVGQSTAKGVKGKSQKDQIETIKKFKAGQFNVLVATSIGEEGLDIGEIDLIVCYEANKSPIRMLQRVGRTGRRREGRIIVLMTEGREEKNWDKANDAYTDVQNALISNKIFELYVDGDRMLPKEIKPVVEKIQIKALPLDLTTMTMGGQTKLERKLTAEEKKRTKANREEERKKSIPEDAFMGFRTAGALAKAKADKPPDSPGEGLRKRKAAALLNADEETSLRQRWQYSGSSRVIPAQIDTYNLPFERGRSGSALRIPRHSSAHNQLLASMRQIDALKESKVDDFDAWHKEMSEAFDRDLIQLWQRPIPSGPRDSAPRKRLRISPPPLDPLSSYPVPSPSPSALNFQSNHEPNPVSPTPSPVNVQSSPRPRPLFPSPPPIRCSQFIDASTAPAPSKPSTFDDRYNMLSSDDEAPEPSPRPPVQAVNFLANLPAPPSRKPSSSYSVNLGGDEFEMDFTDSQLLEGAVVVKKPEVLVISDDDDQEPEHLLPPTSFQQPPRQSSPPLVPPPQARPPPLPPQPKVATVLDAIVSPEIIPESEDEVEEYLMVGRAETLDQGKAEEDEFDEYSFFDLPEEALEACLAAAAPPVMARLAPSPAARLDLAESEDVDDSVIMPPPKPPSPERRQRHTQEFRPRPRHHQIPDSSSSVSRGGFYPSGTSLHDDASEASPIVGVRHSVARGKAAVVESSSPPVAGPSRIQPVVPNINSDSPASIRPNGNGNRLRRGKQPATPDPPLVEAKEGKRVKRRKLTEKETAKSGLFDFEAVNSSASGTEASSEAYSAENSDDRNFVASQEEMEDSPRHHAFLRESLLTQAPPGFGNNIFRPTGGVRPRNPAVLQPGTPMTPNSQDHWSYDSFCVNDDDEIEMLSSSQL